MKSLQKDQNSTNIISAGKNVQSPPSESTPRRLTLPSTAVCSSLIPHNGYSHFYDPSFLPDFVSILVSRVNAGA